MLRGGRILLQNKYILRSDCVVRSKHSHEGIKLQPFGQVSSKSCFHQPQAINYPAIQQLPLPLNIEDLASSEKLKFSPRRDRDISSSYISSSTSSFTEDKDRYRTDKSDDAIVPVDKRIECYDCSGTISLSSAMQTTVPFPFVSRVKPIHLNMPGGQWRQGDKYVSGDLNNVHHCNMQAHHRTGTSLATGTKTRTQNFFFSIPSEGFDDIYNPCSPVSFNKCQLRKFCTTVTDQKELNKDGNKAESKKIHYTEKLKMAVKDYGPVLVVFHVSISLVSLGVCYLLVSSGIDLTALVKTVGVSDGAGAAGTAAGFVVAYAVHKTLAPARVGLTLTVAPFVVRKLRKMGILKNHQPKP